MNLSIKRVVVPLVAAGVLMACVATASAQHRTLQIRNGEVRVDDRMVPRNEWPASLEVEGVDLTFSFSGIDRPVVKIGDSYYVIADRALSELDENTYRDLYGAEGADEDGWYRVGFSDEMTKNQMRQLDRKAAKMRELSEELAARPSEEENLLAEEMKQTAQMAAEMAAELPKVQALSYWDQVKASDRDLYNQLVREWQLEAEIQELAHRIRQASASGGDAEAQVAQLRSLLEAAFELKQNNRRREIKQLEQQLHSLDNDMRKREDARKMIIERRLEELIGRQ
ncbi:MAG: hypothetical protein KJO98_00470 [Rhodothermia bacterium]|nr:hypothetical protein [Rhodothermia bacterium]